MIDDDDVWFDINEELEFMHLKELKTRADVTDIDFTKYCRGYWLGDLILCAKLIHDYLDDAPQRPGVMSFGFYLASAHHGNMPYFMDINAEA